MHTQYTLTFIHSHKYAYPLTSGVICAMNKYCIV